MNIDSFFTDSISLYSRVDVLSKPNPVPQEPGLYAWFFKQIPLGVPADGCRKKDDKTLLYVGISPKNEESTQDLRKRITTHFRGNAEGSTLRLTLGTLLVEESHYPLRRVGSGKRMTFTHSGEQWIDAWMSNNAYVCWVKHPAPWEVEREIIETTSLPLNIRDNEHHPFSLELSRKRRELKRQAREMSIANEDNQKRSR